jgi:hypothetical protein
MGKAKTNGLGIVELRVWGCHCRCGHLWIPREWLKENTESNGVMNKPNEQDRPRVCPECKSANWDKPKKFERK